MDLRRIASRVASRVASNWHEDANKVLEFGRYLVENGKLDSAKSVLSYFEKPYHWDNEHKRYESTAPSTISEDEFERVFQMMQRKRAKAEQVKDRDYYLEPLKDFVAMANGAKIDARQYYEDWKDSDFKQLVEELGESTNLKDYEWGTEL